MTEKEDKGIISKMKGFPGLRSLFGREAEEVRQMKSDGMLELSMALSGLSRHIGLLDEDDDKNKLLRRPPADRLSQYQEYDLMEEDPICGRALRIHVDNALNRDEGGGSIRVEGRFNDRDPVVMDLRNTFQDWLRENAPKLLFNIAKYGCWGIRPYFLPDYRGIDAGGTSVGPEGHPASFRVYELLGRYAGAWSEYQKLNRPPKLSEPWQFIVFKSPGHRTRTTDKARRFQPGKPGFLFDIWDDFPDPAINETFDYGRSLFYDAYTPWKTLEEAYLALLVARLRTARKETMLFYPVSNQDPAEAAQMVRNLTETLQARDDEESKRSLREGLVRISRKLILPYDSSGKGKIDFAHNESEVNIKDIEDISLAIKILCGSLGVDPGLVGFSDMSQGEAGRGGDSIAGAAYGIALRQALRQGIERMYEIHVKLKWGKIYNSSNKPWKTALRPAVLKEKEMSAILSDRADFAERLIAIMNNFESEEGEALTQTKQTLKKVILNNILKLEEPIIQELSNLSGRPDERTAEKADKFFDLTKNERTAFVEEQINQFWENNFHV